MFLHDRFIAHFITKLKLTFVPNFEAKFSKNEAYNPVLFMLLLRKPLLHNLLLKFLVN